MKMDPWRKLGGIVAAADAELKREAATARLIALGAMAGMTESEVRAALAAMPDARTAAGVTREQEATP